MLMYCIRLENFLCPTFMLRFQNCMPTMCGWRCSHLIQSLGSSSKPHIFIYFKTMLKRRGFIQFQSRFYPSCSQIPKQWLVVSSVIHHQNLCSSYALFILFIYLCMLPKCCPFSWSIGTVLYRLMYHVHLWLVLTTHSMQHTY